MEATLHIIQQKRFVYLVNPTPKAIKELIYTSVAIKTYDDCISMSSIPKYKIEDFPASSYFRIEDIDPYEDGLVSYVADRIVWEDGSIESDMNLKSIKLFGGSRISGEEVELKRIHLSTEEGKTLRLDE